MTRMNRTRYQTPTRSHRWRPILAIVLVLGIAFAIFRFAGVGGLDENNYQTQRDLRLRSEAQHAVSTVNSLSRLGASSTSSALGRIRQYIHGIETLNELNVGIYGEVGRLYVQSTFDDLYALIDEYDSKLISGQRVSDTQSALSEAVEALNDLTLTLLD